MAGFLCDYSNNKVLDMIFGGTAYSPPTTLYFGRVRRPHQWKCSGDGGSYFVESTS